jgi:hypothetical protein
MDMSVNIENLIESEILDTVNAIRLACQGDKLPHYNSTRGTTLFKSDNSLNNYCSRFFFLKWTKWQKEENQIIPCTEEQAFQFLYGLYGSRYTDITDEDLDELMRQHFPNRLEREQ